MKKTIIKLWNENINPNNTKASQKEKEIVGFIDQHYNDLKSKLNDSEKDILQKFADCYDELITDECERAFIHGFSLAVRLMVESLT